MAREGDTLFIKEMELKYILSYPKIAKKFKQNMFLHVSPVCFS